MTESFFWRKVLARTGLARYVPSLKRALDGGEAYLPYYSDRMLAAPLGALQDAALLPTIRTPDSIDLAVGSPRCDLHLSLPRAYHDRRPESAWGDSELREELAARFHRDHGPDPDPAEEVLITHGATGAFAVALDAFINPGDRVVLFDPTSPIFSLGLEHRRAAIVRVPTWSEKGSVRFAMDVFAKAMRGAKMLVLADPANPTGGVFAAEDLEQIAFWTRKTDAIVFQDASFDHWRAEPARARLAALPHAEGRTLTCGSFAKSHGLSAIRVGWLTGHRHLVRPCALAATLAAPFISPLCQQVALTALRTGDESLASARKDMNDRREYVGERLRAMGLAPWTSAAGFFYWIPVPAGDTGRSFAQRLLSETGVLVNPGEPFSPTGSRFIRLTFATDEGRLRTGLNRLAEFLVGENHVPSREMQVS